VSSGAANQEEIMKVIFKTIANLIGGVI